MTQIVHQYKNGEIHCCVFNSQHKIGKAIAIDKYHTNTMLKKRVQTQKSSKVSLNYCIDRGQDSGFLRMGD